MLIPQGVAVVTYAGDHGGIAAGCARYLFPDDDGGGSLTASQINVGKNVLIPPM